MTLVQHRIPDPPPIAGWQMTQGATGCWTYELVGRTIITSYEMPREGNTDDDRSLLLRLDSGKVILIGVDIGYHDDEAVSRNPDVHELCMFDATATPAGVEMLKLAPGEWT